VLLSLVFLQLYHDGQLGGTGERPLLVPQSETLRALDYIPPYETHKLGVIYVGPGQAGSETAILQNEAGSMRYTDFLKVKYVVVISLKLK
jgi:tuberous sclerosis protein 2